MGQAQPALELPYSRPVLEVLSCEFSARLAAFKQARSAREQVALVKDWDQALIDIETLDSLARIRFAQDTRDPDARRERVFWDQAGPQILAWNNDFLQEVLASPHQARLKDLLGPQALTLWQLTLESFQEQIADCKRQESELCNRYNGLMASLQTEYQGEVCNLAQLGRYYGDADRRIRLGARRKQDELIGQHADELGQLYDKLVGLRHGMARDLGLETFTSLGYRLMRRTDYGPEEVADFRAEVRRCVVPLATRIHARRAGVLGVSDYAFHDESVRDLQGVPKPQGDLKWMVGQAQQMFDALGPDFGAFFTLMRTRGLMDLNSRPGKAGGGFCEGLSSHGVPFIFANFNGTQSDVTVFTHECGHAFQYYCSRTLPLRDYFFPTYEACEIHSMGLEFLTYPHMQLFFGDDATRFRHGHLEKAILFLPYGAAIDHFQHRIYAEPGASPARRAQIWQEMEAMYLPHRRYEQMPCFAGGHIWYTQAHVFTNPFYYIDYCLAESCALQLWELARRDRRLAMERYRKLCHLGGSRSFTELLDAVELLSPFKEGSLDRVVDSVARSLDLA